MDAAYSMLVQLDREFREREEFRKNEEFKEWQKEYENNCREYRCMFQ